MRYDLIIVGGGISGIYLLYQIAKAGKSGKIAIFERSEHWGGRIHTIYHQEPDGGKFKFEGGAARFCSGKHRRFEALIRDFHLENDLVMGGSEITFLPSTPSYQKSREKRDLSTTSPYTLIQKVIRGSRGDSYEKMIPYSFLQYAAKKRILNRAECQYLKDSFGYSAEIKEMNAYNAIEMFRTDLNKKYQYYSLRSGLSHLIVEMIKYIKEKQRENPNLSITFYSGKEVSNIYYPGPAGYEVEVEGMVHYADKLVCAVQKAALKKMQIFRPILRKLNAIEAKSLCRIYMIFPNQGEGEKYWFDEYGKITTNSPVRYMIPLDKKRGSIMISYTDSQYADAIYQKYQTLKKRDFERYLLQQWEETLGLQEKIPRSTYLKVCYWKEGVAMWRPKYDSRRLSREILQPYRGQNLFIIGENYSMHQAWIEGALDTAEQAFRKMF